MFHSHDESKHNRLLFISYANAFEIRDRTDLESLQEVLNINIAIREMVLRWTRSGLEGWCARLSCLTSEEGGEGSV
jgi:hypothetical protein